MFAGDMFLPAALMISSFLRSTIRTNPSSSMVAMSPVRSQPSSSIVSAVFSGWLRYPAITVGARTSNSPSGSSFSSTPGIALPTVPKRRSSCGHERRDRGQLRHPPHLADRDPDGGEELEHLERRRRCPDDVGLAAVEAEPRPKRLEHARLGLLARRRQLVGHGLALLLEPNLLQSRAEPRRLIAARFCSSGSVSKPDSRAAFSFSQIRGTAPNRVGRASAAWAKIWVGSWQQVSVSPQNICP